VSLEADCRTREGATSLGFVDVVCNATRHELFGGQLSSNRRTRVGATSDDPRKHPQQTFEVVLFVL